MIFNLFKSKPTLKELIPKGFVDIHSHILPGIDDGAKNIEESLALIEKMIDMNFSKIIATPHIYPGIYENDFNSIEKSYISVKNEVSGAEIKFAAEYMLDFSLVNKAKEGKLICLKDDYVLVEMSYLSKPENLYEILFILNNNSYKPVLAHPERYRFLHDNFKEYFKLKNFGCFFQINLLSTTGYYGKDILKITDKLLNNNVIDFVGSDIHNLNHIEKLKKKVRIDKIESLAKKMNSNSLFR